MRSRLGHTEDFKTVRDVCTDTCSEVMNGCKEKLHEWCWQRLATNAAFTAKAAAWLAKQRKWK